MIDNIMKMVSGDALSAIAGNSGISMDQAKQMLPLAKESLSEGLMSEVKSGNMDGLVGLFNSAGTSGLMNNGIFSSIKGMFMRKIMSSLGLPESVANLAAGSGMTSIISSLAGMMRKDGDNEGIDASNIMNVLGVGGGAAGMLGGLMGKTGGIKGKDTDDKDDGGGLLGGLKKATGGIGGF